MKTTAAAIPVVARGRCTSIFIPRADFGRRDREPRLFRRPRRPRPSVGDPWQDRGRQGRDGGAGRSGRSGLGLFSITPDAAETYRLTITSPAGIAIRRAAAGIFGAADRDRRGAGCLCPRRPAGVQGPRGERPSSPGDHGPGPRHARGQQMLVTSSPNQQAKVNAVSIPLDDQVAGVIRLTAYDYTTSPPKVLAQRLVYRQPRRLVVARPRKRSLAASCPRCLRSRTRKGGPSLPR